MQIPVQLTLADQSLNLHLLFEYLAFFIGFRYYLFLRKRSTDEISRENRLSIILGMIIGALVGSRMVGFLENPLIKLNYQTVLLLMNTKSVMGGIFGGLLGVEITKKIIGEKRSSGDLFTFPLIAGIIIGRIGCFLSGINEFTYGKPTTFFMGMNLGDGLNRHPTSLYEILFLLALFAGLYSRKNELQKESGRIFKIFMLSYFLFRFLIEFLKPNVFFLFGLSSIQWLCIICYLYYFNFIKSTLLRACQKLHLLRFHS